MLGYCMICKKNVEMNGVSTIKLRNERFTQIGKCAICGIEVYKKVKYSDIAILPDGKKFPKKIYVGEKTPIFIKKYIKNQA